MTKTEKAQWIIRTLYNMTDLPKPDNPRVKNLVRKHNCLTVSDMFNSAFKAYNSNPKSYNFIWE